MAGDPKHYQGPSGMSCADFIRDVIGPEGMKHFWRGNAMKYIYRAGTKGGQCDFKKDISKAIDCLQRLLNEDYRLETGEGAGDVESNPADFVCY